MKAEIEVEWRQRGGVKRGGVSGKTMQKYRIQRYNDIKMQRPMTEEVGNFEEIHRAVIWRRASSV